MERINLSPAPDLRAVWPVDLAIDGIGLVIDEYRQSLPARDLELLRTGDTRRKAFDSQQDVESYK